MATEEPEGSLSFCRTTLVPRGLMIYTGTEDVFSPAMIAAKCVLTMEVLKGYQVRCASYTIQKDSTKHHPDVLRFILLAFVDMGLQQQFKFVISRINWIHAHSQHLYPNAALPERSVGQDHQDLQSSPP